MAVDVQVVHRNIRVESATRNINVTSVTRNIEAYTVGRRGPQGIQGPQGIPGSAASDKNYVLDFTNSDELTVTHSLAKYPSVTIVDSSGDEVVGAVEHLSINQLIVTFSASFSGRIICN